MTRKPRTTAAIAAPHTMPTIVPVDILSVAHEWTQSLIDFWPVAHVIKFAAQIEGEEAPDRQKVPTGHTL